MSTHARRLGGGGGTPVLFSVAPFVIHWLSVRYPVAVGSSTGPPVCLMSVVIDSVVPSNDFTVTWNGGMFFTSIAGRPYGP